MGNIYTTNLAWLASRPFPVVLSLMDGVSSEFNELNLQKRRDDVKNQRWAAAGQYLRLLERGRGRRGYTRQVFPMIRMLELWEEPLETGRRCPLCLFVEESVGGTRKGRHLSAGKVSQQQICEPRAGGYAYILPTKECQ